MEGWRDGSDGGAEGAWDKWKKIGRLIDWRSS